MKRDHIATLFMNGGSQAVRLPKEFRFAGSHVRIRKEGKTVILEPVEKATWPAGYWERLHGLGPLPEGFRAPDPLPPSPHRDAVLDELDES